jgi:hypothetical protein
MRAGERTRRDWSIALAASVLVHALVLGFVRFARVPSADVADDATPVAILRITKRVSYAHGRRGGAAAAPAVSHEKPNRSAPVAKIARGATALGSRRATTTAAARPVRLRRKLAPTPQRRSNRAQAARLPRPVRTRPARPRARPVRKKAQDLRRRSPPRCSRR